MSTSDYKRKPKRSSRRERRREMREEARAQARLAATASGARRILRIAEVEIMTGKARTQIYDEIQKGIFPQPVPLGERAVGWLSDEIAGWQEARIAERSANTHRQAEQAEA
jgi:prophage regulatory protein